MQHNGMTTYKQKCACESKEFYYDYLKQFPKDGSATLSEKSGTVF